MKLIREALFNKRFLVILAIFSAMAVGMERAASAARHALRKRPVPIRRKLDTLKPERLKHFKFVEDIGEGSAEAVETSEYIEWRFLTDHKRPQVAYLDVYYYTEDGSGKRLMIPHTPEVCYGQTGIKVTEMGAIEIPTPGLDFQESVKAKYVRMSHPTDPNNKDICIVYLFCVNGEFYDDREKARVHLALPWNPAVWFAKIDCVVKVPRRQLDKALDSCKRMLSQAIPILLKEHFPTETDLKLAMERDG